MYLSLDEVVGGDSLLTATRFFFRLRVYPKTFYSLKPTSVKENVRKRQFGELLGNLHRQQTHTKTRARRFLRGKSYYRPVA